MGYGAGRGGRTLITLRSRDFKSRASANSAIPAFLGALNKILEATTGIEPVHRGFADRSLTTWVRRLKLRALKFWLKRPALLRETLSVPLSYLDITAFIQIHAASTGMALAGNYDSF